MSTITKFSTPQIEIGEPITVVAGSTVDGAILSSVQKNFVLAGQVYNKADYPELYARIGSIGGSVWNPRATLTSVINDFTYGNGIYVAVGGLGIIATSTNAITWTSRTSGTTTLLTSVVYGNGIFVCAGWGGAVRTSTDGITWTLRTSGTSNIIECLTYGNGLFIFGGWTSMLRTSTDGITWTSRTSGAAGVIQTLTYGNGLYVYGETNSIGTSTDGITWTTQISGNSFIYSMTYGNGRYVYGTALQSGLIGTSTDGVTWTFVTEFQNSTLNQIQNMTYGNGIFVYGTNGGTAQTLKTSTDAINWTTIETQGGNYTALYYANGIYLAAFQDGTIRTSTTATNIEYSAFYNASTQFLVPNYNYAPTITITSYAPNSRAQYVTYVRAK